MPRRCVAAGCNTVSGDGYSLHAFPRDQDLRAKWIRAVKRQRSNWDGPSAHSMLCSKHFAPECFATEGVRYRDAIGLPTKKRLKPDAMPTIFPLSIHCGGRPCTPPPRSLANKRQRQAIVKDAMSTSVIADEFTSGISEPEESPVEIAQEDSYSEGTQPSFTEQVEPVQAVPEMCSIGIQCNLLAVAPLQKLGSESIPVPVEESLSTDNEEADLDTSYQLIEEDTTTDDDIEHPSATVESPSVLDDIKYIVFKSSLLQLFTHCTSCHDECNGKVVYRLGTFIAVKQSCTHCGHKRVWTSQPRIKSTPAGNILLSASILYSGATPGKVLRLMRHMQVACISDRTFYSHQHRYLEPSIVSVWGQEQSRLLSQAKAQSTSLSIGGDGRADSLGHSAKYGSYGIIDLHTNKVLHIELVQSNEVKSSNHMEKEGLRRALVFLAANSMEVSMLITDRHKQINKFLNTKYPEIEHWYDVWHVSKGLKKKLAKLSQYKDCDIVGDWTKSITNHMYWCAASAPDGDGQQMVDRWKSLMSHLCDEHDKCYHLPLGDRRKKWFIPGSKAYELLTDIIFNKHLLGDIKKLSPSQQTSSLESYHSVVNHFAPKLLTFSYVGMHCRLLVAAMHFNENFGRAQAITKSGKERIQIVFPKQKQGEFTPKIVKVTKTYKYADALLLKTIELCTHEDDKPNLPTSPLPLASQYEHPDKDTIPIFSRYS